jgi:hypothetical protein
MASPENSPETEVTAQVIWPQTSAAEPRYANMFAVTPGFPTQGGLEEVLYVVAGLATPPILSGDLGPQHLNEHGVLQIDVSAVSTLVVPLSRARELRDLLTRQIALVEQGPNGLQL